MTARKTCETCVFYAGAPRYQCRRNPPTVAHVWMPDHFRFNYETVWPSVDASDWCGSYHAVIVSKPPCDHEGDWDDHGDFFTCATCGANMGEKEPT